MLGRRCCPDRSAAGSGNDLKPREASIRGLEADNRWRRIPLTFQRLRLLSRPLSDLADFAFRCWCCDELPPASSRPYFGVEVIGDMHRQPSSRAREGYSDRCRIGVLFLPISVGANGSARSSRALGGNCHCPLLVLLIFSFRNYKPSYNTPRGGSTIATLLLGSVSFGMTILLMRWIGH